MQHDLDLTYQYVLSNLKRMRYKNYFLITQPKIVKTKTQGYYITLEKQLVSKELLIN